MPKSEFTVPMSEENTGHHHVICWKSALSGVLVSALVFMIFSALGAGIGGFTGESLIRHEDGGAAFATGAGLWLGLSIVISLFIGSFFALRVSRFQTHKVGVAHGVLVASIFFVAMMIGLGNMIGGLAVGVGRLAEGASDSAANLSDSPAVQDTINKAIGGSTTLKSPPKDVAQGLATRLLQGDTESAKTYYAYQSGLSQAEVDAKVTQLQSDFNSAMKQAGEKAAHAVGGAGWSVFLVLIAGLISAAFGGRTGAGSNNAKPFYKRSLNVTTDYGTSSQTGLGQLKNERGSVAPYVLGWFLGVPVSILFLIAILRSIF